MKNELYARRTPNGHYYIVDKHGNAVNPDGSLAYHPYPCEKGDYSEYEQRGMGVSNTSTGQAGNLLPNDGTSSGDK